MASKEELAAQLKVQSKLVKESQADPNADPSHVQSLTTRLAELKMQIAALQNTKAPKKEVKITLKTAKGTKDWHPSEMLVRQSIFRKITDVFELHGGVTIDTPVFELKEILAGKYGEDSKLIYDLQDQGGEICSLRYDLTVPFARFLAMNGSQYPSIKRYHIAKVYRRDQPVMSKGRMREFYQCDFDIAGVYDAMLPDAEILAVACETLDSLGIDKYTIKVNHRKILDGIFAVCGVPLDKTRAISSAVDKLDKMDWAGVKKEMVQDKGLDADVADRIGTYVKLKGAQDLVAQLEQDATLCASKTAVEGLADMTLLFKYLDIYGVTDRISFDLSLARGLDYYTGIIYEAVTEGSAPPIPSSAAVAAPPKPKGKKPAGEDDVDESAVGVGSIAAGGRYDELVGMFSPSGSKIPCVGISFGVERIFSLMLLKAKAAGDEAARGKLTEVFVMSVGDGLLEERMKICAELWKAGIKAEFAYKVKPKLPAQWVAVDKDRIPYAVIIGTTELAQGNVNVKQQVGKDEAQGNGEPVPRAELVSWLKQKLGRP